MTSAAAPVHRPSTVEEAVALLADLGDGAEVVAGGTWVMRWHHRGEAPRLNHVLLTDIPRLADIDPGDPTAIGALVTHRDLAERLPADGPLAALARAAATSAFPAVRNVATVGGNLCAGPFPEADLVPALLALDAEVEVATPAGRARRPVQAVLGERPAPGELVVAVHVPAPEGRRSGFERLTVRGGGEYALASVALSVDLEPDGTVAAARLAVGAVEHRARRCPAAEAALTGRPFDDASVEDAGRAAADELDARDGVDAPGWYRLAVLPALALRAATPFTRRPPA